MSDGSIVFDTKIDRSGFKKDYKSLEAELKQVKSSMSALDKQIEKQNKKIIKSPFDKSLQADLKRLQAEYDQLAIQHGRLMGELEKKAPGLDLASEIDKTTARYSKLIDKQQEYIDLGKDPESVSFRKLQRDIDVTKSKLDALIQRFSQLDSTRATTVGAAVNRVSTASTNAMAAYTTTAVPSGSGGESNGEQNSLANTLKSLGSRAISGVAKAFSLFSKGAQKATVSAKQFGRGIFSLGNMLKARIIERLITGLINGNRIGLGNYDQYSEEANASVNQIKNSITYAFNAMAAAVSPLLNVVAPVLSRIIDMFAEAANAVARFFAMLTGKSTYVKATKQANDLAGATEGVASAADEAKGALAGIDEVNDISSQASGGGSGGSGSSGAGDMFTTEEVAFKPWEDLKEAIDSGDWEGVGKALADRLNKAIAKIDWSECGKALGEGINNVISFAYGWFSNVDTTAIGNGVATFLNNAISTIDWSKIGGTLAQMLNRGLDMLVEAVFTLDWSGVGLAMAESINGFLKDFNFLNIIDGIVGLAIGILELLISAVTNLDWSQLFYQVGQILGDVTMWLGYLGLAIVKGIQAVADYFAPYVEQCGGDIVGGILLGIVYGIANIGVWLWENLVKPIIDGFCDLLGIHSPSTVFEEFGINMIEGLLNGLSSAWTMITEFFSETLGEIVDFVSEKWDDIKEKTSETFTEIGDFLSEKWDGIKRTVSEAVGSIWDGISEFCKNTWDKISQTFNDVMTFIGQKVAPIVNMFQQIWDGITQIFSKAGEWFGNTFGGAWQAVKDVFSGDTTVFRGITDSIANTFRRIVNSLISGINRVVAIPFNGINSALRSIRNVSILGAKPFSWLPSIGVPQIPYLASGTVVPRNAGEFFAVLGDNRREPEVVSPLSTIKEAVKEAMAEGGNAEVVAALYELIEVVRKKRLLAKDVGKASVEYINGETDRTGKMPIKVK